MTELSIIGIDLAKRVFQLHGASKDGTALFRKKLQRRAVLGFLAGQPHCTVAMEACASAHHWGREIRALGHEVRLLPPAYVKPFVKRHSEADQKTIQWIVFPPNDMADAEAIAEAAARANMRAVAVKNEAQLARAMLFRTRDLLVGQRTQLINARRAEGTPPA